MKFAIHLDLFKKKHKIIGIYMVIGNLDIKFRSEIKNIHLVALCKEKYVKTFKFSNILEPIINDIIFIETKGIEFKNPINNNYELLKGTLFAMIGDNLGSHQVGGFTENFSTTKHICRYCYYDIDMLKKFEMSLTEERSIEGHNEIVRNLETSPDNIEKGVKGDSYLNKLKFYHVCNPGLPPCIAHDLYEGIIPFDLLYIINYFILNNYITLDYLNMSLSFFRKKFHLRLSFPLISKNMIKLPGKSNEMFHLLNLLPLIFLNKVKDFDNNVWKFLTVMIEMCRIINSPTITQNQTLLLSHYIRVFFEYRRECFPTKKLRPKHHFICHYPELIRKLGPLKNMWTLPFEQKHQYFKNKARKVKNFKNIVQTLANNHQQDQAVILKNSYSYFITSKNVQNLTQNMFNINLDPDFIFVSKQISFLNTVYKENDIVLINCDEEKILDFIKIVAIFINKSYTEAIVYGKLIKMIYNESLILYENLIDQETSYSKIKLNKILFPKPVNFFEQKNKLYYSSTTNIDIVDIVD